MARQQSSGAVDEPNLIVPLASSYNERGVQGFLHSNTNSEDQRKLNCIYEFVKNPATGKGTLTLSKRPGVTLLTTLGTSGQAPYLILDLNTGGGASVMINKNGNDNRASSAGHDRIILTSTTYVPIYADTTAISNVTNGVVQLGVNAIAQRVFFATVTDIIAGNAWTEIVDADFTGLVHIGKMEHLDGFAFILTTNNLIWNSDSNSLANWTATSFLAKQIKQDRAVGLARLSNQILAFGEETVEAFYNAGNTVGSPLARIPSVHSRVGLVSTAVPGNGGTHYYCTIGQKLFFVGRLTRAAACGLYSFDGNSFDRVSNSYIDKILSEKAGSFTSVNAISISGAIFVAIGYSLPGASTQNSILYSPTWNEWFEWNSTVFSPVNQGQVFLGAGTSQNVYNFTPTFDNWQDAGTSYQAFIQFRIPTNGSSTKFLPMYGVDADTDSSGIANTLTMEISTTDPQTYSTLGTIDLSLDRKVAFEGGSFTKAWMRLGNTNSRPFRIHNFLARIE